MIAEGAPQRTAPLAFDLDGDGTLGDETAGVVSFTGFGYERPGNGTDNRNSATSIGIEIRYLGLDGVVGGDDDVSSGAVTLDAPGAGNSSDFFVNFDEPLPIVYDGLNNQFDGVVSVNDADPGAIENFSFRFAPSGLPKLGFAGTYTPGVVPEPATAGLLALGAVGMLARRRR